MLGLRQIDESVKENTLVIGVFTLVYSICLASWWEKFCCDINSLKINAHYFDPFFIRQLIAVLIEIPQAAIILSIAQVLIPTLAFLILVLFFKRYVSALWAVFLALVGFSFIENYPFRIFLWEILQFGATQTVYGKPVVASFPYPSVGIFVSLLVLYWASVPKYFSLRRAIICTTLVALLTYVHALNAAFLSVFWFGFYMVRCLRQYKGKILIAQFFLPQIVWYLFLILPALIMVDFSLVSTANNSISSYYVFAYIGLPVLILLTLIQVRKIDFFEVLVRFTPIYLLMFCELMFIAVDVGGILRINFDKLQEKVIKFLKINGSMSISQFKDIAETSRKYAVPLLEYFDKKKITYRDGNERKLLN